MSPDDRSRSIGKLVSVSSDRFVVELHRGSDNFTVVGFDDVHYVARLGSFIIIPVQADYVVAEVEGLRENDPKSFDKSATPGQLDKAQSAKFLDLSPVGMLPGDPGEKFRFGVSTFPSLYADALYALDGELDRIFDVADQEEVVAVDEEGEPATRLRTLTVGSSVVFKGYDIKARIPEIFGGHLAVLGNTGSGKSCTVATLLQSLFEKTNERLARGASFLLLDVNGEYRDAFQELPNALRRSYWRVSEEMGGAAAEANGNEATFEFRLPHWFLNTDEWELLLRASEKTQQPVLRTALGMTSLLQEDDEALGEVRRHILAKCLRECFERLGGATLSVRVTSLLTRFGDDELNLDLLDRHGFNRQYGNFPPVGNREQAFHDELNQFVDETVELPKYRGHPFDFQKLESCLDLAILYEEAHGNSQIRDYCSQLVTRLKSIGERPEFAFLRVKIDELAAHEASTESFVDAITGAAGQGGAGAIAAQVNILDFNEASDEVVEVTSAVITRMVFERLRRAEPRNERPINIILEEAHRYISQRKSSFALDASHIFERVAKEGRKYGLLLAVSSQRPSELSKTVLSQCSNFIVHRIQNPDDLIHIRQMTPFISESVLRRLPSLPRQHALIFGNAVNIPTTFRVRDADPRPKSDDAQILDIWFRPATAQEMLGD